jgi:hypothetical protein
VVKTQTKLEAWSSRTAERLATTPVSGWWRRDKYYYQKKLEIKSGSYGASTKYRERWVHNSSSMFVPKQINLSFDQIYENMSTSSTQN